MYNANVVFQLFVLSVFILHCVFLQELNLYHDITWRNGGPPRDEPECGFEGEKCINEFGMILF